jgi:hypothetical protein
LKSDNEEDEPLCVTKNVSNNDTSENSDNADNDDNDSVILMKSDDESIITVDSKVSITSPAWKDDDDEDVS